jgi:hypothetical protein
MPAEQEKKSVNKLLEKTRGRDLSELLEQIHRSQIKTHQVLSSVISMCLHIVTARKRLPGLAVTLSKCALTSSALAKKGFAEAFRTIYPDEMENFGYAWTPIARVDDPTTHRDRIFCISGA